MTAKPRTLFGFNVVYLDKDESEKDVTPFNITFGDLSDYVELTNLEYHETHFPFFTYDPPEGYTMYAVRCKYWGKEKLGLVEVPVDCQDGKLKHILKTACLVQNSDSEYRYLFDVHQVQDSYILRFKQ